MATFPNLKRVQNDDKRLDTGLSVVYSPKGNQFGQSLYTDDFWIFNPTFINVTEAEKDALEAFFQANKTLAFDYLYEDRGVASVTYECRFLTQGINYTIQPGTNVYVAQAFFRGKVKP